MRSRNKILDVIRGFALLMIVVDHLQSLGGTIIFGVVTLNQFGLSGALEVFVFVSGFVFALAYSRTLKSGLFPCRREALRRGL